MTKYPKLKILFVCPESEFPDSFENLITLKEICFKIKLIQNFDYSNLELALLIEYYINNFDFLTKEQKQFLIQNIDVNVHQLKKIIKEEQIEIEKYNYLGCVLFFNEKMTIKNWLRLLRYRIKIWIKSLWKKQNFTNQN